MIEKIKTREYFKEIYKDKSKEEIENRIINIKKELKEIRHKNVDNYDLKNLDIIRDLQCEFLTLFPYEDKWKWRKNNGNV